MWKIEFVNTALKDSAKVRRSPHHAKVTELLVLLSKNPFQNPPPYEKLEPPTANVYSRRINSQHRLTYTVDKDANIVTIRSMWTHYE